MEAAGQPETLREDVGRVVQADGQLVEEGSVAVERVLHRSLEELLPTVEVVVEGAHPHVRGLGELENRDVQLPGGDEGLGRAHQRGAGTRFAPFQAVRSVPGLLRHPVHLPEVDLRSPYPGDPQR